MKRDKTKVLLVEDDYMQRDEIRGILNRLGYLCVEEVTNGLEALEKLKVYAPDLVFMDTNMPFLRGDMTCIRIRQLDYGRNFPIIGMSVIPVEQRWIDAGADGFLTKPFRYLEDGVLEEMIRRNLKKYSK